jgi:hypothetical protein
MRSRQLTLNFLAQKGDPTSRKISFSTFIQFFLFIRSLMTLKALVNLVENDKNFTVDQK